MPVTLSIALDAAQKADGYMLAETNIRSVESGIEFYTFNADQQKMTVSNISPGKIATEHNITQIEQIVLTFIDTPVNAACARYLDGSLIQVLSVSTYNYAERKQVIIKPKAIPDAGGVPVDLRMDKIRYVAWGVAAPGEESKLCSF